MSNRDIIGLPGGDGRNGEPANGSRVSESSVEDLSSSLEQPGESLSAQDSDKDASDESKNAWQHIEFTPDEEAVLEAYWAEQVELEEARQAKKHQRAEQDSAETGSEEGQD